MIRHFSSSISSMQAADWYRLITLAGILLYIPGLGIDVMEIDAAQYAAMSMEMHQSGQYLQIYEQGRDYLDKPPLLFWLSSFFISIFGNTPWAYKLPSFIFSLLAIYSVWRFSRIYWNRETAWFSAMVLTLSQGMFIMNNDVRTDNLLMGSVSFALWMLAEIDQRSKAGAGYYLGTGIGIGLAMLAKGPLGLVIPALGFGPYWLIRKDWRKIFNLRWIISLVGIIILLAPMLWGLYMQFDAQPDKIVHGRQGVSGLRFFFWEQSFGRITGESSWKNDSGPFFFLHTYLWAFFPWVIWLVPALIKAVPSYSRPGGAMLWAWGLTFLALSASRFKLPHYIYVTLPFASVLIGRWYASTPIAPKWVRLTGWATLVLAIILIAGICIMVFPLNTLAITLLFLGIGGIMALLISMPTIQRVKPLLPMTIAVLLVNSVLNLHFYPELLRFQGGTQATLYYKSLKGKNDQLYITGHRRSCAHFHHGAVLPVFSDQKKPENGYIWVMVNRTDLPMPSLENRNAEQVAAFSDFPVSLLNLRFLNQKTRHEALDTTFLFKIRR
jgi:4-amino-4-deoxy-L-arabinose transferase-like glycosyltransferase